MAPNTHLPWPKQGLITKEETEQFPHLEFLPATAYPGLYYCITPHKHGVQRPAYTIDGDGNIVPMQPPPPIAEPVDDDREEERAEDGEAGEGDEQQSGRKGRKKVHSDRMKAAYHLAKLHYAAIVGSRDRAEAAAKVFNVVCRAEIRDLGRDSFSYTALESTYQQSTHGGPSRVAHWQRIKQDIDNGRYDGLRAEIEEAARQL
ncbi:hypothetical protein LTR86_009661 [Recurvomyces mirabilis]|nr:hypothetical protein LTR86_009661 [Recurvomyces mirabilis]